MINKKFKEDWSALLKINKETNNAETPQDIQEKILVPFTPLKINVHLLYYLSQYLYPKFINDQKNVIDIIISDYDIDNIAFDAFLYNTSRLGIYDSLKTVPKGVISFKQNDMDNLEQLFINIQSTILENSNIRIASVRFFRRKSIDLINRFYEELEKYSMFEFLYQLVDLIQKMIKEDLFIIYPEPNIINFLRSLFIFIGNLKLSNILKQIFVLLPIFNQSIIFHSDQIDFIVNLQKPPSQMKPNLKFAIKKLDLDQNPLRSDLNKKEFILLNNEHKNHSLLVLQFEALIEYFLEVSELQFPINKGKIKLLLQKFSYAFSKIGTFWNVKPRPRIYSSLVRFIMRLFSFNVNLRNISYWAIPDYLFNLIDTYLGLNFKLAIILTDTEKPVHLISIKFHNGTPLKMIPINRDKVINAEVINPLKPIWNAINSYYGYHAMILKLDIKLFQKIFSTFLFKFNKFGPFSLLSIIRMVKKSKYFDIYPLLPPFQLIKNKNSLILIKMVLDNLIDKYEF